jgi:ferredoxin-NADP reductase
MSTSRRAVVVEGELVAPGVRRVRLRVLDAERLGHRAGQYILLHARAADGTIVKRAYSVASPPREDPFFELCVRLIPERPASGFVHSVTPGTQVPFTGPWGKFVVDDDARDLVLVATGSAISCTGAIIEDELGRPRARRLRFLWGLRDQSDIHRAARFEELAAAHSRFSYQIMLSRPGPGWSGSRERVTVALRAEVRADALYYLAGNGAMVADAEDILATADVPPTSVRKEVFFTPGQVRVPLRERQARAANRQRLGRAVVGIALHAGTPVREVIKAVEEALALAGVEAGDVRNMAAAAKASDEPGLIEASTTLGLPVEFYLPAEVEATGASTSACETLAGVSAASTSLILPKHKTASVTVAIAAVSSGEGR